MKITSLEFAVLDIDIHYKTMNILKESLLKLNIKHLRILLNNIYEFSHEKIYPSKNLKSIELVIKNTRAQKKCLDLNDKTIKLTEKLTLDDVMLPFTLAQWLAKFTKLKFLRIHNYNVRYRHLKDLWSVATFKRSIRELDCVICKDVDPILFVDAESVDASELIFLEKIVIDVTDIDECKIISVLNTSFLKNNIICLKLVMIEFSQKILDLICSYMKLESLEITTNYASCTGIDITRENTIIPTLRNLSLLIVKDGETSDLSFMFGFRNLNNIHIDTQSNISLCSVRETDLIIRITASIHLVFKNNDSNWMKFIEYLKPITDLTMDFQERDMCILLDSEHLQCTIKRLKIVSPKSNNQIPDFLSKYQNLEHLDLGMCIISNSKCLDKLLQGEYLYKTLISLKLNIYDGNFRFVKSLDYLTKLREITIKVRNLSRDKNYSDMNSFWTLRNFRKVVFDFEFTIDFNSIDIITNIMSMFRNSKFICLKISDVIESHNAAKTISKWLLKRPELVTYDLKIISSDVSKKKTFVKFINARN